MTRLTTPDYCVRCENELDPRKFGDLSWCFTCKHRCLGMKILNPTHTKLVGYDDMGCYMEREV